ncbi:hypothetical protein HY995_05880 [Candidatus Micrarchaeota archaeon]|nr:hypothetical protein [Candidatus Micrarchaeota archaeon]MBI5177583.1 hypothetical protein [Candidatus Micrarchaeota archaeon]
MNQSTVKPLNKQWLTSFRKEKKLDDYLLVGDPLIQWISAKGEWRKLAVRCTAVECLVILKHAKYSRRLHIVVRGKGGEYSNFAEALGELIFLTDRLAKNDYVAFAFPQSMRDLVISQAQNMPANWRKLEKTFNCAFVFFVPETAGKEVEQLEWRDVLKQKV